MKYSIDLNTALFWTAFILTALELFGFADFELRRWWMLWICIQLWILTRLAEEKLKAKENG